LQSHGYAQFENNVVGVAATTGQMLNWKTDHCGAFLQGGYAFGPL